MAVIEPFCHIVFPLQDSSKIRRESQPVLIEPPHLCYENKAGDTECQVYTVSSRNITITVQLNPAENNDSDSEDWCRYPLGI